MTLEEFSNGFDILVNSYRRFRDFDNQEPVDTVEFDEYEKSLYLTKAQEELVVSLYNGRNLSSQSFEETEELRRYLSELVEYIELEPIADSTGILGVDSNSKFFNLPDGSGEKPAVWFITYEAVGISDGKCEDMNSMEVVPVRLDEYYRIRKNPFRGANNRRVLRLDLSDGIIEIVSNYNVTKYYIRYLRKPNPIILENLPNNLTVENIGVATPCELHEALHLRILEIAVDIALRSKVGGKTQKQ